MIEKMQKKLDDCIQTKISDILQRARARARAQHSDRMEKVQLLQSESTLLRRETDILRDRKRDLCVRTDDMRKDLNKVTHESSMHKKVRGQ